MDGGKMRLLAACLFLALLPVLGYSYYITDLTAENAFEGEDVQVTLERSAGPAGTADLKCVGPLGTSSTEQSCGSINFGAGDTTIIGTINTGSYETGQYLLEASIADFDESDPSKCNNRNECRVATYFSIEERRGAIAIDGMHPALALLVLSMAFVLLKRR